MKPAGALAIDARCVAGGVRTYAVNVIRELRRLVPSTHLQLLTAPETADTFAPLCDELSILSAPIFSIREQFEVPHAVSPGSLLHCTHYNASLLRRGPLVVTIPDITPLLHPDYHSSSKSRIFAEAALRAVGRRADHIITVSEYSRARLVEKLRIPAAKISVAYNGVSEAFRPMESALAREICAARLRISAPFLLHVGLLRAHKNVPALLRAYKFCRDLYHIEHHMVIIGSRSPQQIKNLQQLAAELNIGEFVRFIHSVDESTLVASYNAADAVVVPSLEEGFGFPVVEAMACGTPVACSDASALPEIAGDAAAYFDPRNPANMADVIQTVLERSELRRYMRIRGLAVAAQYTWAASAQVHYGVYSNFLDPCPQPRPRNRTRAGDSGKTPLADAVPMGPI